MRRFNIAILVLLFVVGAPYYWFMLDNSAPAAEAKALSISQLRALAGETGEPGPRRIRFELIARQSVLGNRVAAGTGLRQIELYTLSYMLEYADAAPVLIGSGITEADAAKFGHEVFFDKAQARVTTALGEARALIPLAPVPEQLGALRMLGSSKQARTLDANLAKQQEFDRLGAPHAVAPGVVVIPTPRHLPGSRLVYVRLESGKEYLFVGNLAPIHASWSQLRLPARFVTDIGRREDRQAIRSWLLALRSLRKQVPGLTIVSGNRVPKGAGLLHYFDESANIVS